MTDTSVGQSSPAISGEPLVGAELISIAMQLYQIELNFSKFRLCIFAAFSLNTASGQIEIYDPSKHQGNTQALWPLVGHTVTHTNWNHPIEDTLDNIEITFDDGTRIGIPPDDTAWRRGTLWDKSAPPGVLYVDDF